MNIKLLFTILLVSTQALVSSQTTLDYRSSGTGNWNNLSSWQYRDANNVWKTPTLIQGYPGQNPGTGTVVIQNSHIINIDVNITNNFTSLIIGSGISGALLIASDILITTPSITINKGGELRFLKNINLTFPANSSLIINKPGSVQTDVNCTNNNAIFIGLIKLSTCNGQGNSEFTFDEINENGGTLNALPAVNAPYCENSPINLLGSFSGGIGTKNLNESEKGVNFVWSIRNPNGVITSSNLQNPNYSATVVGTYSATLTLTTYYNNKAYTNTKTISFDVFAKPNTPIVGKITPIDCVSSTGSIVLTGLPASWTLIRTNGSADFTFSGTGTTTTITGLTSGTYSFKITNANGCASIPTTNITIQDKSSSTWSSGEGGFGSWSNGIPTLNTNVILTSNYDTSTLGNIESCSLSIASNITLTIKDRTFVTIENNLIVNTNAQIVIENQGSLVMINDAGTVTNNGIIKVNKTTTPFEKFDYTYWSSPITSTPINNTAGSTFFNWRTDYAFSFHPENFLDANQDGFDDDGNDYLRASSMNIPGRGYVIMGSTGLSSYPANQSVVFTANTTNNKLNTGVINTDIALTPGGFSDDDFNLIGNPYPSAINADQFIQQNKDIIDGTLYFWTHKKDISANNPGPDAMNFSSDDYAVYNLSGGTGTSGSIVNGVEQSNKPLGNIASGQGFFIEANSAGKVTFNNSMRVGNVNTNANTQFYKTTTLKGSDSRKDRLWLNLENANEVFSQQLIGYFSNTTDDFDKGYDGLFTDGGNYVNFYSFINDDKYKIQGRKNFDKNDQVKLGFSTGLAGTFNINIDSTEGLFDTKDTAVFLEDTFTGDLHNLKESPYSFTTERGTFNDRFVLRYIDKNATTADINFSENTVLVSNKNKKITISSSSEFIDSVFVYDFSGKLIYKKTNVDNVELMMRDLIYNTSVFIVKVVLKNGDIVSKKMIY